MAYGDSIVVGDFFYMEDENGKMVRGGVQPSSGGGGAYTDIEVNVSNKAIMGGEFTITTTGLTIGNYYEVIQVSGPYTDKGTLADECLDMVKCIGVAESSTDLKVYWSSLQSPIIGNIKFKYKT